MLGRRELFGRDSAKCDQIDALRLREQPPGGQPGEIEQIVHHPGEPIHLATHDRDRFQVLGRQAPGQAALQELDASAQGGQRRPQLVRRNREEFVPGRQGPLGRIEEAGVLQHQRGLSR